MNKIIWHKRAKKQLSKIPRQTQVKIFNAVDTLKTFPESSNIKRLSSHQYDYRLRIGRYRIFFDFDGIIKIVSIQEVKKRDERTY